MNRRTLFFAVPFVACCVLLPGAVSAADSKPLHCVPYADTRIRRVDIQKVRDTWVGWQNAERKKLGLKPLTENPQLNRSAALWSQHAALQGSISHKRKPGAAYYDYGAIEKWFLDLGLQFKNVNRSTFSESIGYGPYSCSTGDCTSKMIAALKTTFDFYMREKGKKNSPHYNAIVRGEFANVGVGIALKDGTYYLTTHYATSISPEPEPLCRMRPLKAL